MRSPTISLYPLSDTFIRFAIISTVAVVWCSLSIPVEGVGNDPEENLGVQNCLKAIQDVQKDPNNGQMVKRFIDLCKEFIDEMDLSENHTAILEQAGYNRIKKSKGKAEENEKQTTDKKGKTEDSQQKVTPDKKDHIKDPKISDKKNKDDAENHEVSSGKSEADTHDSITHDKEKEDIKQPKLNQKMEKPLKKIHKAALKSDGKDEKNETERQEEKISELDKVVQTESEHQQSKSQESQIPQSEEMQSHNLQEELPPFDFTTFNNPEMTQQELVNTIEELKKLRRVIQMQQASQPHDQHANFPDPTFQVHHESQFDQQFGQGIPQFQYQEMNAQFQNPAFAEGIPHMHMKFDLGNGIPKPTFQQGIPPFPQQAEFPGQFQHQPFGQGIQQMPPAPEWDVLFPDQQFGQGIPQMPPAPEWDVLFPDQQFGQDIPQPHGDAPIAENIVNGPPQVPHQQIIQPSSEAPTHQEPFTKRKIDEL